MLKENLDYLLEEAKLSWEYARSFSEDTKIEKVPQIEVSIVYKPDSEMIAWYLTIMEDTCEKTRKKYVFCKHLRLGVVRSSEKEEIMSFLINIGRVYDNPHHINEKEAIFTVPFEVIGFIPKIEEGRYVIKKVPYIELLQKVQKTLNDGDFSLWPNWLEYGMQLGFKMLPKI